MQHRSVRQSFLDLHLLVDSYLSRAYANTKRDIRTVSFLIALNYTFSVMLVFAGFAFIISPKVYQALHEWFRDIFGANSIIASPVVIISLTILLSIILIAALYSIALELSVRFAKWLNVVYFVQSSVIFPVALVVIEALIFALVGSPLPIPQIVQTSSSLVVLVNVLYLIIDGLVYVYAPLIPGIFLAILYGTNLHNAFKRFPSHDSVTFGATELSIELTQTWSKELIEGVIELIEAKRDGLNGQGQAVSFILAAIALAGLIGIDKVASVIQSLMSVLLQLYGATSLVTSSEDAQMSTASLVFAVALFLLFVYIICSYFSHSYNTLRVLEIMAIACKEKRNCLGARSNASNKSRIANASLSETDKDLLSQLFNSKLSS